ncbi:hypothetical protein crov095 [Cafeteria roenbergensis virus]|uniref:Uncharacterized protein n=1 Tax=Cafeteria roenbergensis virus (strain BV-PW1) TaxID=693272 RepID=E3T4L5_CROVB|nr:hypothetical protein crov095 [Cafeteria roenbergensis virus BV-PW1]ADO67128.1 hypothetical protein crov095 [Cafeteria roenbergensis virus BV-PW1]
MSKSSMKEHISTIFTVDEIITFVDNKSIDPGTSMLILKQLVETPDNLLLIDKIINKLIVQKTLKWRHLKVVLPLYRTKEPTEFFKFYQKHIMPVIPIEEKLILGIIDIYPELIELYLNQYVIIDKVFKDEPEDMPKVDYSFLLNQIEVFIKKSFSQKGLTTFLNVFPTEKYDLVFDGNNILLNKKGIFEVESFKKLHSLVESTKTKGYTPLVFIHIRHVKTIKRLGLDIPFAFISTPYRYNDDWFSLYYAIKHDIPLVSRDIFRDHINQFDTIPQSNLLKIFLHHRKISINKDFTKIIFKDRNIPIIFKNKDGYYIPGKSCYLKI